MDTLCEKKFMFLNPTFLSRKLQSYLKISIAFFSDTVRPRNLKLILHINPYRYSLQTKFHDPRLDSFREKCDDNLQKFQVPQLS